MIPSAWLTSRHFHLGEKSRQRRRRKRRRRRGQRAPFPHGRPAEAGAASAASAPVRSGAEPCPVVPQQMGCPPPCCCAQAFAGWIVFPLPCLSLPSNLKNKFKIPRMEGKREKLTVIYPKVSVNSALWFLCHVASSCKEKGESSMLSVRLIRGRTQTKQADTVLLAQSLSPKKIPTPPPPPSSRGCWGRGETSFTWKTRGGTKINPELPGAFSEWEERLLIPAWRSLGWPGWRWGWVKSCFRGSSGGGKQSRHLGALPFPGTSSGPGIRCEEITPRVAYNKCTPFRKAPGDRH